MNTISEISAISNTDIEFVVEGRLFQLEIGQDELDNAFGQFSNYWENPYTGKGYYDTEVEMSLWDWKKLQLTEADYLQVITANRTSWEDITEYTDKGLAMLEAAQKVAKTESRRKLLSWIVSGANKLRSVLKSMSLAMHTAWTRARILAAGAVQFVKMGDVDNDTEIPVQNRRVADGGNSKNGLLLFTDLEKYETAIREGLDEATAKAKSFISMHVWQVVSWNTKPGRV